MRLIFAAAALAKILGKCWAGNKYYFDKHFLLWLRQSNDTPQERDGRYHRYMTKLKFFVLSKLRKSSNYKFTWCTPIETTGKWLFNVINQLHLYLKCKWLLLLRHVNIETNCSTLCTALLAPYQVRIKTLGEWLKFI